MKQVFFDVETKKLFSDIPDQDPGKLEVSIVSLYCRTVDENQAEIEGKMYSFWESEFDKMWPFFQNAQRIIGFNSINFDVPALQPYAGFPFKKLPHFDIMEKFKNKLGHRISLDAIAKETLDRQKIDSGLDAVYYWRKGDKESLYKLRSYCEDDVAITRDIYDFVVKRGYLLFKDKWNTLQKTELDFGIPKEDLVSQAGLF